MTNKTTMGELEFLRWVGSEDDAVELFEQYRWPKEKYCPKCGSTNIRAAKSRKYYYQCRPCRAEFSCKVGTIMESSRIPVKEWMWVMYKLCVSRKGISSLQLAKELNRPQKTAWFLLQRIKQACGNKITMLNGTVEADEVYVGGKEINKHESQKLNQGRGSVGKQPVLGLRQRGGQVLAKKITKADVLNILGNIYKHVETGSVVYSDEHRAYQHLGGLDYSHDTVKHSENEYVKGLVHTNSIESVWAILKRTITGVHHHISFKHLQRYLNEVCYRLNEGNVDVHVKERVGALCSMCAGARLTWKNLTTDQNPKD